MMDNLRNTATSSTPGRIVPAYILVGFLGSGKTTLLGRLIGWCLAQGLKPGLILNEIGSAWIDADAVRQEGLELTEIADGCLCCTAEEDLIPALTTMAANPQIDLIILEASGLADPADMLDALTDTNLWQTVEVGGIISVVDGSRWHELCEDTPLARRQVRYADVLVLNKCDLISSTERQILKKELSELAPRAQLFPAENGLPYAGIESLLEKSLQIGRKRYLKQQDIKINSLKMPGFALKPALSLQANPAQTELHGHESMSIHVSAIDFNQPVDKVLFENFLRGLPKTILRAKGFVKIRGDDQLHAFQHIYGYTTILPATTYQPSVLRGVFIGQELDTDWLAMRIADCQEATISF